jgi:hypothetical protein
LEEMPQTLRRFLDPLILLEEVHRSSNNNNTQFRLFLLVNHHSNRRLRLEAVVDKAAAYSASVRGAVRAVTIVNHANSTPEGSVSLVTIVIFLIPTRVDNLPIPPMETSLVATLSVVPGDKHTSAQNF